MLKRSRRSEGRSSKPAEKDPSSAGASAQAFPIEWQLAGMSVILIASLWAYWPTLAAMVRQWYVQPDYSHGFLVIPLSAFFLWSRRSQLRRCDLNPDFWGAALMLVAAAARVAASYFYLGALDGWTFPIWIAGIVLLMFGWGCLRWSLPAIVFLWFMVPIPFSAETWLSVPLQRVATKLSTELLVILGQPAIAEGSTIWIGDNPLYIEEACSGLRILVGIYALAFAFVLFSRWQWWQKGLALIAALPIAIAANVARVVITGLLYQFSTSQAARHFMHDFSGLAMIPLAAAMFWLFLMYLDRLFPEIEELSSLAASGGHL
jgi:exosortase